MNAVIKEKLELLWMSITFAEAGEVETALQLRDQAETCNAENVEPGLTCTVGGVSS